MTIKGRLWVMITSAVVGLIMLSVFSLQSLHNTLVEEKQVQLVKLVDGMMSQLHFYHDQATSGKLTQQEAQAQAIALLKRYRYGNGDYFWINDLSPRMIMHPTNPKLDGTDLSNNQDKKGNRLFMDMVAAVKMSEQGGFVTYYWNRPNSDIPIEKLSHVRQFAPWGWIIGTGIYVDDIQTSFISALVKELSVIVVILLVVLLMAWLLVRSLTSAIKEMVGNVEQVATLMQFSNRLPARQDELNAVSVSMNHLLSALEQGVMEANRVVGAIAHADFAQTMRGHYTGDLARLQQGVNASAQSISFMMFELEKVMQGLYAGRFDVSMDQNVPKRFRDLVETSLTGIRHVIVEINKVMTQMTDGDFNGRVTTQAAGDLLLLKNNINASMDAMATAIAAISVVVEAQAQGDLTKSLPAGSFKGQLHDLKNAINFSSAKVKESVIQAIDASHLVNEAAAQVSQGSSDLSGRVQEQAAALEQTSATMNEMATAVQANTANANKVAALAHQVQHQAGAGVEVMQQTIAAMQSIKASSSKIADIVTLIDGIAFQTNLLALNAAVEAARAGDHGRGFAVVAGEVRALAQKSAAAAKDIKDLISDSVNRIEAGTHLADKSGEMLSGITGSIEQVAEMIEQIANASAEQTAGIGQVHRAIADIDRVTQENAALVEETTAAAESLSTEANHLKENMSFFKTGSSSQAHYVAKPVHAPMKKPAALPMPSKSDAGSWNHF